MLKNKKLKTSLRMNIMSTVKRQVEEQNELKLQQSLTKYQRKSSYIEESLQHNLQRMQEIKNNSFLFSRVKSRHDKLLKNSQNSLRIHKKNLRSFNDSDDDDNCLKYRSRTEGDILQRQIKLLRNQSSQQKTSPPLISVSTSCKNSINSDRLKLTKLRTFSNNKITLRLHHQKKSKIQNSKLKYTFAKFKTKKQIQIEDQKISKQLLLCIPSKFQEVTVESHSISPIKKQAQLNNQNHYYKSNCPSPLKYNNKWSLIEDSLTRQVVKQQQYQQKKSKSHKRNLKSLLKNYKNYKKTVTNNGQINSIQQKNLTIDHIQCCPWYNYYPDDMLEQYDQYQ